MMIDYRNNIIWFMILLKSLQRSSPFTRLESFSPQNLCKKQFVLIRIIKKTIYCRYEAAWEGKRGSLGKIQILFGNFLKYLSLEWLFHTLTKTPLISQQIRPIPFISNMRKPHFPEKNSLHSVNKGMSFSSHASFRVDDTKQRMQAIMVELEVFGVTISMQRMQDIAQNSKRRQVHLCPQDHSPYLFCFFLFSTVKLGFHSFCSPKQRHDCCVASSPYPSSSFSGSFLEDDVMTKQVILIISCLWWF